MTSPNYTSGLRAQNVEDIKPPATLPTGTAYPGVVKNREWRKMATKDGEVEICTFTVQMTDWSPEVPDNERIDSDGRPIDITKKSARMDYWDNERGRWDLGQFLLSCGLKGDVESSVEQAIGANVVARGTQKFITNKKTGKEETVFNLLGLVGQH